MPLGQSVRGDNNNYNTTHGTQQMVKIKNRLPYIVIYEYLVRTRQSYLEGTYYFQKKYIYIFIYLYSIHTG